MKLLLKTLVILPLIVFLAGCQNLPGTRNEQGTIIGGAAGAAAGAAVTKHHLLGALIGGALGAGGGYVIAANTGKIKSEDQAGAAQATRKAQENPATPQDAKKAMTADLNNDGFVTLDEVVALKQAGYSDQDMISRLKATDQVFELNPEQEKYLTDRGVDQTVITQMEQMNRSASSPAPITTTPGEIISAPPPPPAVPTVPSPGVPPPPVPQP